MDGCLKHFKVAPVYIRVSGPAPQKGHASLGAEAASTCETVKVCLSFIYYTVARKTAFNSPVSFNTSLKIHPMCVCGKLGPTGPMQHSLLHL